MSNKPEGVTDEAWEHAKVVWYSELNMANDRLGAVEVVARAITAAVEAEREAILQFEFDLPIQRNGADMMIAIREYIRSRTPS